MLNLVLALVITLIASTVSAGVSGGPEAWETVVRLRKVDWGELKPEYLSVEDAYSKARNALLRKEIQESERLFRLTVLKGVILERKRVSSDNEELADADDNDFPRLVGEDFVYTVRKRDSLRLIAAKFGVSKNNIIRQNRLKVNAPLKAGQRLQIVTRRILPKEIDEGIVINIPDRILYLFKDGKLENMYPVAVGKPSIKGEKAWHTPTGNFSIVGKLRDPAWRVPPSIKDEMGRQGKEVLDEVPPGDANPLGRYALRTSIPGILIHGTNTPSSVYAFSSHGCIRVYPDNMKQLFLDVKVHTQGKIIYKPIKLAESDQGRVYMEVHNDVYDKVNNLEIEAWKIITSSKVNDRVDWEKVMNAVRARSGVPEDVSLGSSGAQSIKINPELIVGG